MILAVSDKVFVHNSYKKPEFNEFIGSNLQQISDLTVGARLKLPSPAR